MSVPKTDKEERMHVRCWHQISRHIEQIGYPPIPALHWLKNRAVGSIHHRCLPISGDVKDIISVCRRSARRCGRLERRRRCSTWSSTAWIWRRCYTSCGGDTKKAGPSTTSRKERFKWTSRWTRTRRSDPITCELLDSLCGFFPWPQLERHDHNHCSPSLEINCLWARVALLLYLAAFSFLHVIKVVACFDQPSV